MNNLRVLMIGPGYPSAANSGIGVVVASIEKELAKLVDLTVLEPEQAVVDHSEESIDVPSPFSDTAVVRDLVRVYIKSKIDTYLYEGTELTKSTKTVAAPSEIKMELEKFTNSVIEKTNAAEFDIIYAHDWTAVNAGLALKEKTGKPLVFHIHSLHVDRVSVKDRSWVFEVEKTAIEKADAIITVSKYTAEKVVHDYDGKPEKITVIYPAVPELKGLASRDKPTDPTVLFLGRFASQKAPNTFLKIAEKILEKRSDIHFLMVGDGEQHTELIEISAQRKLSSNVHFSRYIDHANIAKVFARSSVICIPSISEPFGLTAVEAAAFGVPVVISRQSGASEILEGAQVVDNTDINGFATKILKLLSDSKFADEAIHSNKQSIKGMSWQKVASEISKLFRATVN